MSSPYRSIYATPVVMEKKRPLWKTLLWKIRLAFMGDWRKRHIRCAFCRSVAPAMEWRGWMSDYRGNHYLFQVPLGERMKYHCQTTGRSADWNCGQ
jgi:hypothetical protein